MTRLLDFGRSTHSDHDGCTGQERPLAAHDHQDIRQEAVRMMRDLKGRSYEGFARRGGDIALHYGPQGEWFLCRLLADWVRRGVAPAAARDSSNIPQMTLGVAPGDPHALALLATLAAHHHQTPNPADQHRALEAARLPLQTFLLHMVAADHAAARRQWEAVFHREAGVLPLAALGFTAQLALWAARSALSPAPTPQPR